MHCFARIYPSRAIVRAQAIPIFFKKTLLSHPTFKKRGESCGRACIGLLKSVYKVVEHFSYGLYFPRVFKA